MHEKLKNKDLYIRIIIFLQKDVANFFSICEKIKMLEPIVKRRKEDLDKKYDVLLTPTSPITAFKIALNVKLNEIMPVYNKMFDFLDGWDLFNDGEKTIRDRDYSGDNNISLREYMNR